MTGMAIDYHAYLASREWAVLKRKVRERSGGLCERCGAKQQATHHLTYERLGHERLDDLQAVCNACHKYLSAVDDRDPANHPRATLEQVLEWAEAYANEVMGGHITLLRFTTGWKVLLGTPEVPQHVRNVIAEATSHPTLMDALAAFVSEWADDVD